MLLDTHRVNNINNFINNMKMSPHFLNVDVPYITHTTKEHRGVIDFFLLFTNKIACYDTYKATLSVLCRLCRIKLWRHFLSAGLLDVTMKLDEDYEGYQSFVDELRNLTGHEVHEIRDVINAWRHWGVILFWRHCSCVRYNPVVFYGCTSLWWLWSWNTIRLLLDFTIAPCN